MEKCKKCGRYKASIYSECECEKIGSFDGLLSPLFIPDLNSNNDSSSYGDSSNGSSNFDFGGGESGGAGSGGDF